MLAPGVFSSCHLVIQCFRKRDSSSIMQSVAGARSFLTHTKSLEERLGGLQLDFYSTPNALNAASLGSE